MAAGDLAPFGGDRARGLQAAGQQLGQGSDSLFGLYERKAQEANETRVQDLNNGFITRMQDALRTGPDGFYKLRSADAIQAADAATETLKKQKTEIFGQAANDYERNRLGPILDAHLAASAAGIVRHTAEQQVVYGQRVAATTIDTSRAEALDDPTQLDNAVLRAEGAARVLNVGQPPEVVEAGAREAGASVIADVIGDRLARNDALGVALFQQYGDRLDPRARRTFGAAVEEAYSVLTGLKDTAIKSGWLRVRDASPTVMSDYPSIDEAFHEPGAQIAQAEPAEQKPGSRVTVDFGRLRRMREEEEQAAAGTGGSNGALATEPDPGTPEYQAADEQARQIAAEQAAEESGGQGLAPATEPPPGSPEHQGAEKEPRQATNRQEAGNREADRMITRWLTQQRDEGSVPKLPPVLAEWLSPEERRELEALAVAPDTQTDPDVYNRVLSNLLNYNSQVRLKWAREPLFRYRKSLSAEDFAKLARIQRRLDPETGQVSGFAPVPADLVPLYDWLAPDPDWDYGTVIATKGMGKDKDWRVVMPSPVRSFFKGMLDLFAAQETGELTTDALESFMTLHSVAGTTFGPRGGEGTLAAGGKRPNSNQFMTWSGPRTQPPSAQEIAENERVGRMIAGGHASLKHFHEKFPDMRSLDDFARHISEVMTHWTEKKHFADSGRTIYWHGPSGTTVWRNPQDPHRTRTAALLSGQKMGKITSTVRKRGDHASQKNIQGKGDCLVLTGGAELYDRSGGKGS